MLHCLKLNNLQKLVALATKKIKHCRITIYNQRLSNCIWNKLVNLSDHTNDHYKSWQVSLKSHCLCSLTPPTRSQKELQMLLHMKWVSYIANLEIWENVNRILPAELQQNSFCHNPNIFICGTESMKVLKASFLDLSQVSWTPLIFTQQLYSQTKIFLNVIANKSKTPFLSNPKVTHYL